MTVVFGVVRLGVVGYITVTQIYGRFRHEIPSIPMPVGFFLPCAITLLTMINIVFYVRMVAGFVKFIRSRSASDGRNEVCEDVTEKKMR